jgi:hypothetical protein
MSETPLTDAYKASREVGEDKVGWCEFARTLERELSAATERERGLLEALRKHGGHTLDCTKWDRMDSGTLFPRSDWTCSCGLDAALSEHKGTPRG